MAQLSIDRLPISRQAFFEQRPADQFEMNKSFAILLVCGWCLAGPGALAVPVQPETDPELSSGNFEGDLVLDAFQKLAIVRGYDQRNGLLSEQYRWPNKTVYYKIDTTNFTAKNTELIKEAMAAIARSSCLNFTEASEKATAYIHVVGETSGCYSSVGYMGRVQKLNLAPGCLQLGTIMHEFLHAIGFYHMQSASDRDNFVKIIWKKIKSGKEHNFKKHGAGTVGHFNGTYDYGSLMHYSATAFSIDGNKTIVPKQKGVEIGQRKGLSPSDVAKLRRMYKCD
ncbi:zinc metalloproteinase nas-13-like [Uranotaenia lowii]|uniref:zinc metalloproteinase nas-13-like n=1 Tax=Uranotaenia lowii TaxID=190385 RepID=UPI00247A5FDD|nr:zinc metalloproteinase nas-13-like [Uranotaenia lowii]